MDLTKQPPRRPSNITMAGIVGLARMTDKARGDNDETIGEYVFGAKSGLDTEVLAFVGMTPEEFAKAADELEDGPLADLVAGRANKSAAEIEAFNHGWLTKEPQDDRHRQLLVERVAKYAPERDDIKTVLASMELDDWGVFWPKDLTQGPPRSAYWRSVAGVAGAARMADKARAYKSAALGEYRYGEDSGLDRRILGFLALDAEGFAEAARNNPNDKELTEWVEANSEFSAGDLAVFNQEVTSFGLNTEADRERFIQRRQAICPDRADIETFVDLIDYDDEHSFGLVDLTRHAPRSPYDASVGGLMGLARMIDKGRATNCGTAGSYWYGEDSGFDRIVLRFLGVEAGAFAEALKSQDTDQAIVDWLGGRLDKSQAEIDACNTELRNFGPTNERQWNFLRNGIANLDPSRSEIATFGGLTVLDDYVSFARFKARV